MPRSKLREAATERAREFAAAAGRPEGAKGVALTPLNRELAGSELRYDTLMVELDRENGAAQFTVRGPEAEPPADLAGIHGAGVAFWPLALARDLDDAILHLRANEPELGTWVLRTEGDGEKVAAYDALLEAHSDDWLVREITLYLKRTFKRLDVSSRSMIALIEPGSCFTGTLLELALAADRSYMLEGTFEDSNLPPATVRVTGMNFGPMPMGNGLTRLETRLLDDNAALDALRDEIGEDLEADVAEELGLVTFIPDDIDWEDEVRLAVEERHSFSPDSLTGMEASLRFAGPETLETKIFGRLTAWQNWIFQRPNAVGEEGALKLFGTGKQAAFDRKRV